MSPFESVGEAKLGLELKEIAPSDEILKAEESTPLSANSAVSLSASVPVIVTTEVCPFDTSVLEGKLLITGALSLTFWTVSAKSTDALKAESLTVTVNVYILSESLSDGFSKSKLLTSVNMPELVILNADASVPEILNNKASPSSSVASIVTRSLTFSLARI